MRLSVRSPDDLLAALPHLLGFKPSESLIFVPMGPGLHVARVDTPTTPDTLDQVWHSIRGPFKRYTHPGASLGIVCVSADLASARTASQELGHRLTSIGIATRLRVWADDEGWCDLDTGANGLQTQGARERIAAEMVLAGRAQPALSRESLAAALVGDRKPVIQLLPKALVAAERAATAAQSQWALNRLRQFEADGIRLSDNDATRLLVSVDTIDVRDRLWNTMSRATAPAHVALWTDMTRRAPDEVRAAPASLLGFASWLNGDGAMAWSALDQVPQHKPYPLAELVAAAVQGGIHPREWENVQRLQAAQTIGRGANVSAPQPRTQPSQIRPEHGL